MLTAMPSEIAARILDYLNNIDFCAARLAHPWFLVHTDGEITQQRRLAVWSRHDLDLCRKGDTVAVAALAAAGHHFTSRHLGEAAAHGHIGLIDLLLSDAVPHTRYSPHAMNRAAEAGRLDVVAHLHEAIGGRYPSEDADGRVDPVAMDYAARGGHLDIVKWLHENSDQGCTYRAMDKAAANGHVEVLQWLHDHRTEGCTVRAGSTSCSGNVQAVEWVFGHLPQQHIDPVRIFRDAASRGYMDVLCWLHANGRVPNYLPSMGDSAAAHGRLDVLQWMATHVADVQFDVSTTQAAAQNGHLDVVEWLCDNYPDARPTPRVLTTALNSGHMSVVNYLCERQPDLAVLDSAIDTAVSCGCFANLGRDAPQDCFDALEWLRVHRPDIVPSQSAMGAAIFTGHLDVAQWLYTRYGTGCITESIDTAAATGRVDLIDWVRTTYGHACTVDALHGAAEQGHVAILEWLHDHFPHLTPTTSTLDAAARGAHLGVLQWLHQNHPDVRASDSTLALAIHGGNLSVVRFLCNTYALEITETLIAEADRREHFAVVDYLRSVRAARSSSSS
ncbi:Ankyrin repeat domain containing protein [Pandoravirus quercus]|uniref:Ankyrin repeat domain containing protein n=1 Tax=Pandoravirus quercus TaxID=2107709 RepID=A0A2U7UA58_9VIRU|nr:Ankyrin repeat domain containing protein [Pandoravirus quercus]AVK75319.1 Ankyrin repeat domain containing protein [Pandoravirus quercus]